jgi:tRNA threonylcarbamoyladenosine biosynthesis protein TsaE
LASVLEAGQVICLAGDLGAGKTLLVQGLASALGIEEIVNSPTFTILNVYEASFPIYHFDLYRLDYAEELFDIGFYEYTEAAGLAIIEWPDKFPGELPDEYLWIDLKTSQTINERIIEVRAHGAAYEAICEELKQQCPFLR